MTCITQPICGPICGPVVGAVTERVGGRQLLLPPEGFEWTPPINIYKQSGIFTTDFNAEDWKPETTATLYVALTGHDATGDGSQSNPYQSIKKALTVAASLPDAGVTVFVQSGNYDRRYSNQATTCDKDICLIAVGGPVTSSQFLEPRTWTETFAGSGTYQNAATALPGVWDRSFPDADGVAQRLVSVASQAACEGAPGSFYASGTTLYVHTQDGRIPDSNVLISLPNANGKFTGSHQWYVEGISFQGGPDAFSVTDASPGTGRLVFNNCEFGYSVSGNGLSILGCSLVISNACKAYGNHLDGLNYHAGATSGVSAKVFEISCQSYGNGTSGDNHDNASTSHETCRVVRVNGNYRHTFGPVVADIGSAQSWNLGCSSANSQMGDSSSQDTCWQSGDVTTDTSTMWLDACTGSGSHFATYTYPSAYIKTQNCTLTGASNGNVIAY